MLQATREILISHIISLRTTLNCIPELPTTLLDTRYQQKLLDTVKTFSKDIDMKFGVEKCANIKISWGKQTSSNLPLKMNNLIIQPVANGDTY